MHPLRRIAVAAAVIAATVMVVVADDPDVADSSDNFVTLFDVQGPDDVSGQADIVSVEVDSTHLGDANPTLWARWSWDETGWSGKNTGDACALFDTDGDGNANYGLCVSVGGNPASQTADSPRLYSCTSDSRNDRCTGDTEITPILSSCSVAIVGGDTVATCAIDMDDVGGTSAVLLNGCSFNSREPNSNPPDCVLQPGMGVTVVKDVTDDAAVTSGFEISVDGSGVISESTVGDGTFFVPLTNGTHAVAETVVPPGYSLSSSTCTSGSPSAFTLTLGVAETVTCTFVNAPTVASPSMIVTKSFGAGTVDAGAVGQTFTVSVRNDGTVDLTNVVVADVVDPGLTVTGVTADPGGDCSATVANSVSCTIASVAVGQAATVTVTYAVAETVEPTTISNTASVTSDELSTPQTATDSVVVTEDVVLAVTKAFTADPVAAGTTGNSFTIVVANSGISDAENVNVVDTVDPGLVVTGVTASPVGDCSASSGQVVDCTIADLGGSSSTTITVMYDIDESAAPATVANTASATSDEVATPVTDTTSVAVVEDVDLSVVKAFATDPVAAGSSGATLSITVTNNGTSDAENVAVTDVVAAPLAVTGVSSTAADCSASAGQSVDCSLASLAAGASVVVTVTFDVAEAAAPTTVTNTAAAASDEVTTPVTGTDSVAVVEDVVLDVVKTFGTAAAPAGSTGLVFTIEVTNSGLSDAENVVVTDAVDSALTVTGVSSASADCTASSGQSVACSLASLAAGATATVTVTYEIDDGVDPVTVANTAGATSDEVTVPSTASDSVDVVEDVDLAASKVFSPANVVAGSTGNTFALTVTNGGLSDADNVSITDLVDPDLQVTAVSISPGGDCSASTGQTIDCTVAALGGGETVVLTVTYSVDSGAALGPIANSFSVTSDEDAASAGASVDVVTDVGFLLDKSFDAAAVVAGSTGRTFTISVTNSGTSDATGVTMTDAVDPRLVVTGVSSASADCSASSGQTVDCSLATLAAGATAAVTVTFDVADTVDAATIGNTAAVDANEIGAPVTGSDSVDVVEDVTLAATKTFADATVAAGSVGHTFTLVATNSGASDADNVTLVDTVPAGLVVTSVTSAGADCSASAGQSINCSVPSLAGGDSVTVTVGYDVAVSADAATLSNTLTVTSDEATVDASDTIDVVEDVVLELSKSFTDATIAAGVAGSTFALTLTNTGLSDAENVSITDAVPAALSVVSVSSPDADCSASAGQDVDCVATTLAPGGTITVTVTYDVATSEPPATVVNSASAASDEDATSSSDTIDVVEDVDLGVTKSFSPSTVVAGTVANSFTIAVANRGLSDAENVVITDVVDSGLTVTSVVIGPSGDCTASAGNSISCSVAVLAAGATATLTVTYDALSTTDASTIPNTAAAVSDEVTTPVTGSDALDVTEDAGLVASKAFTDGSVTAGSTANTFTITVTNTGISTADGVTIVDTVDAGLSVAAVAIGPVGDCSASAGNVVDCTIASLGAAQTAVVTVTYDVPATTDTMTIGNTATIDSAESATPLTASDGVDVTEDVVLSVVKSFVTNSVTAGRSGNSFTIAVTNSGSSDADNVTITDLVDPALPVTGVTIGPIGDCSASVGNSIECSVTTLAPGATVFVTVTYDVPASQGAGPVFNAAAATSDEVTTPVTGSDTVSVVDDVALDVVKVFAVDPVVAGTVGNTFSISVANRGTSVADGVVITDVVDPGFVVTGVSAAPLGDCAATVGNSVSCSVATLAPGATATVTVTFDVPAATDAGSITNTASVISDELTAPATGSDTVAVVEEVVLAAAKAFRAGPVVAGSTGNTFRLTVTNSGSSDADNLVITDVVDPALAVTGVAIAPVGDCSASSGNSVDCSIAALGPGASATITVTYDVPEGAEPGPIANTATVVGDELAAPLTPSAAVSIVEDVDLSISKTFGTATATAGVSGYSFAIAVTNTGQSDAENVRVTDLVAADLSVAGVTPSGGGDCSASAGQSIDCTFASLASGATARVTVRYDVGSGVTTPQTVSNTASAGSDEVTTSVDATDAVDLNSVVAFDVAKEFPAVPVAAGSSGNSFTISVANSGPSDASGITIDDVVDPRLVVTGVAIAPLGDCSASSGQTVDCSVASLAVGESTVVTVTYDVVASLESATIGNTATIDSTVPASSTTVASSVDVVEDVDLTVTKSFAAGAVAAGSTANSFSIEVANGGLSNADGVVVTDTVDPALDVTSVSIGPAGDCSATVGNAISCSVASLMPGATVTVTVFYDIDESEAPTTIVNTASATSDEVMVPVTGADSVDVVEDVDLSVTKSFAPSTVAAGSAGNSFTIAVSNSGLSDADNVAITDVVDASLTVTGVTISPSGDCSGSSANSISCAVAAVGSGATVTVTVFYDVAASVSAATIANTAAVSSDEVTVPVDGSDSVEIVTDVDLDVAKAFAAPTAIAGTGGHSFSIAVANSGLSDATGVVVTDLVDAALMVTGVTASGGGDCSSSLGNTISCTFASLAARATATVTVGFDVPESTDTSTVTNTASATSNEVAIAATGSDSVDVVEDVSLSVAKSFAASPVVAGSTANAFTLSVTNTGVSDADAVVVTDVVDPALTVTAATIAPVGHCGATAGNVVSCSIARLGAGATATVTVTYDVDESVDPAVVANTASAVSDEVPTPVTGSDAVGVVEDVALSLVKSFAAGVVTAGTGGHSFTIAVTNSGASDAENVRIVDAVDPALTVTAAVASATGDCAATAGNDVDCTIARLAAGATTTVTVSFDVAASTDTTTITNTASATSDEVSTAVTGSDTVDTVEDVVLLVAKSFVADPVAAGTAANEFTIAVTNTGTSDAESVVISDTVDPLLTVVGAVISPTGDCSATVGNAVSCEVASLGPGATAIVTVTYDVAESVDPAVVANTASAVSDEVTIPVTASASLDVVEDVALTIDKAFDSATVVAGTAGHTFSITVANTGTSDAENVRITDVVGPALTVVGLAVTPSGDCSASAGSDVDCVVAVLAAGASVTVTVTFDVDAGIPPTAVTNTAGVTSDEVAVPVESSTSVDVTGETDLSVDKSSTPDPYVPGEPITYTIVVSNAGPSLATAVDVTEVLPAGLTDVVFTPSAGSYDAATGAWTGLAVGPGDTATLTVTATVPPDQLAPLVNTVRVEPGAGATDPDLSNNTDVAQNPVDAAADLTLTKTLDPSDPVPGSDVRFTIVVRNNGNGVALDAAVSDDVDDDVTGVAWSCTAEGSIIAACSVTSGTGDVATLVSLLPGDTATIVVDGTLAADATGTLTNTATVTFDGDTDVSDNTASAAGTIQEIADLTLAKTASASSVDVGATVSYRLTASNDGPSTARDVVITDTLPSGTTFVRGSSSCAAASGVVTCRVGDLASGATASVTIDVVVLAGAAGRTIVNRAGVGSATTDPDSSSDTATVSIEVRRAATTGRTGNLPRSGSDPERLTGLATVLATVGFALLMASRRRRRTRFTG